MLFGWNRLRKLHFVATLAVAIGTTISAFWILSANSWMQTPTGYAIDPDTGKFYATDWMQVVFNPSFPSRFVHMLLAAYITTAAVVLAASAWQLLRNRSSEPGRWQMRMAALTLAVVMPVQIWAGHWSGEAAITTSLPRSPLSKAGARRKKCRALSSLPGLTNPNADCLQSKCRAPVLTCSRACLKAKP